MLKRWYVITTFIMTDVLSYIVKELREKEPDFLQDTEVS